MYISVLSFYNNCERCRYLNDALQKAVVALKEMHMFAYENSCGDKGVIIAENKETAEALFRAKYPKKKDSDRVR